MNGLKASDCRWTRWLIGTRLSPSPLPSPSGRGRIVASESVVPRRWELSTDGMSGSLSRGERAGVRGNPTCCSLPLWRAAAMAELGECPGRAAIFTQ